MSAHRSTRAVSGKPIVVTCGNRTEVRFLTIGAWNTLFGYLAFLAVYAWSLEGTPLFTILAISYIIALVQSYLTQKFFVFRSKERGLSELIRFSLVNTTIFLANALTLPLAVEAFKADTRLVQAAFILVTTVISYLAHKHYSFHKS